MGKRPAAKPSEFASVSPSTEELAKAATGHLDAVSAASEVLLPPGSVRLPTASALDFEDEKKRRTLSDKNREADARFEHENKSRIQELFERQAIFTVLLISFCVITAACLYGVFFAKHERIQTWGMEILKGFATGIAAFLLGRQSVAKKTE